VIYAKAFFDLQLQFAQRVATLSGLPLARILLDYTNLYIRFGLGRGFDPAHPTWREYLGGLLDANDIREWTYRFYLRRPDAMAAPGIVATFGCFSYSRFNGDRIRLHFENADTDGHSSLGTDRLGPRLADRSRTTTRRHRSSLQRMVRPGLFGLRIHSNSTPREFKNWMIDAVVIPLARSPNFTSSRSPVWTKR